MKHRLLLQTNPIILKTGLAENARTLLKYLWKTGKYDLGQYCSQISEGDGSLRLMPWKAYGALPTDQNAANELNRDPGKLRDASYGAWNIDKVIKDFKPTIWLGSDDIWAFGKGNYADKPWYKAINSILHITIDSLPVLEQAYEQAEHTKHYVTWAKFAMREMHRMGPKYQHVTQIYGAMDTGKFSPITEQERTELRKSFGIGPNTTVFLFVGRNQLRKQFVHVIEAFAQFKRESPQADAKLHFHTSFSEKANGWDVPKMANHYGVKLDDILCTYVCKSCGQWIVNPYKGEDLDCPYCKASKSMITANIVNGVPDDQMRYVYGLSDACISAFSSGGQEYHNSQSLLCGKPLASTNYSSGADFCEQPFVHTLGFTTYIEQGTNFIKATTSIIDLRRFMTKVWKSSRRDLQDWGEKGRAWATREFSIETIGAKWEAMFDAMPFPDWSTIDLTPRVKNDTLPMPAIEDNTQFITALYRDILNMNEPEHGDGHKHWQQKLKDGMARSDIYNYFISVARDENAKSGAKAQDFWSLLDKATGRKRALLLVKESIGDVVLVTSLFRSFHEQHPNTDLYVMTDDKYRALLDGNPHVFRVLPYLSAMEQEMLAMGAGQKESYFDGFYHVCMQTQRILSYLSQPTPAFDLYYAPLD